MYVLFCYCICLVLGFRYFKRVVYFKLQEKEIQKISLVQEIQVVNIGIVWVLNVYVVKIWFLDYYVWEVVGFGRERVCQECIFKE